MSPFPRVRSRRATLLALALALPLALAGCASEGATGPSASVPGASGVVPVPEDPSALSPVDVSSPVTGVVVAIEASGLADVTGFTLRPEGGGLVNFRIAGPLENAAEFPLGHLGEHVASASPVRVHFRRSAGALLVTRIEDASGDGH